MDQGSPYKTRDTETYREESGLKPLRYGHRGKILEQKSNGLCCKIKNPQNGPQKIAKLSVRQKTLSIRQIEHQYIGKESLPILNHI